MENTPDLPAITPKDLKKWFARPNEYRREFEEWNNAVGRVYAKWQCDALSVEEAKFLAWAAALTYDTPANLIDLTPPDDLRNHLKSLAPAFEHAAEESLDGDERNLGEACIHLTEALAHQITEARSARRSGRVSSMEALNACYAALEQVRRAVKRHSATPEHRSQIDLARDRTIYLMRRAGKTFGEIAKDLPKQNARWKVTSGQADRAENRYRERGRRQLYETFLLVFSRPFREKSR
jgi:hypothetical protein